jgi:hypothetical protein
MSKHLRALTVSGAIAVVLAVAPALYAQSYLSMSHGSMMGEGRMGGMMEHCGQMMQAMNDDHAQRPNDQWRSPQPEQPAQPRD